MSQAPTIDAERPLDEACRSRNLILDYYDRLPGVIARCVGDLAPVLDPGGFTPGFALPALDDGLARLFATARAEWHELGRYGGHRIHLLDLMRNPGAQTTKTFASLLMVARALEHIRRTGEGVVIVTPTSGNKGIALRDAVEQAIVQGLVDKEKLRIVTLLPKASQNKLRRSRLSVDPELRRLNPVFVYDGSEPGTVKTLAKGFVERDGRAFRDKHGAYLWFSLDLRNYRIADAARAFLEQDVLPTGGAAPRLHAHAVSSAYGLLGYNLGRDVLEAAGTATPSSRPGFLLVQHLGTPDMVLSLHRGSFDRAGLPAFRFDDASGLHVQDADPRFPERTYDPAEMLDSTFYTRQPATAPEMNGLIERFGGGGIVVSLVECIERYPAIRRLLAGTGIAMPTDPRRILEWSLAMAFTGVMNAVDRHLVAPGQDIVVHGTGFYTTNDFAPIDGAAVHPVETIDDLSSVLL